MYTRSAYYVLILVVLLLAPGSSTGEEPDDNVASQPMVPGSEAVAASTAVRLLATEQVEGEGVWIDPVLEKLNGRAKRVFVTVWFDEQFLGDGAGYRRRAKEFASWRRRPSPGRPAFQ